MATGAEISNATKGIEDELRKLREEPRIVAVGQLGSGGEIIPVAIANDGRSWRWAGRRWEPLPRIPLDREA